MPPPPNLPAPWGGKGGGVWVSALVCRHARSPVTRPTLLRATSSTAPSSEARTTRPDGPATSHQEISREHAGTRLPQQIEALQDRKGPKSPPFLRSEKARRNGGDRKSTRLNSSH